MEQMGDDLSRGLGLPRGVPRTPRRSDAVTRRGASPRGSPRTLVGIKLGRHTPATLEGRHPKIGSGLRSSWERVLLYGITIGQNLRGFYLKPCRVTSGPNQPGKDVPSPEAHCFSSFSIAPTTSGASGFTGDSKRATTVPLRSARNFVKFHLMSPIISGLARWVRN
jgi:hypothetical protein